MAAGNFDASAMQVAQVKLEAMFADPHITHTEMQRGEAATARALLERQTATTAPILTSEKCVGADVWFFRPSAADVLSQVSGLSGCAVPTSTEGESIKITLTTAVLAASSAKLKDNRCSNLIEFQDEFAQQQRHIMSENRRKLNRAKIITDIAAASQDNLDTFIDGTWDDTLPRIIVPTADFAFSNLNEFRIVAKNNGFGDFFFLSGRLFNDDHWLAMLNKMNEGERNRALAWATREIYFDERDLDQTITKKTAFAIDANSYIFWNTFRSNFAPTLVDSTNQRFEWAVADPILTWMDNGKRKPVIHEFEMTKTCSARDAQGFAQYTYAMWGRILGGFEFAPEGPNGETGVLQFGEEAV
jgi:hypothetical protein